MSKEFHVFTLHETNHEQAIVFEVDRDEQDSIELQDMWLVTSSKFGEIKTRLNMSNIIGHILENRGGNVEKSSVDVLMEVFEDLISDEKRQEIKDSIDNEEKDVYNMNTEELLRGSEIIGCMDPAMYPEMIENFLKDSK